MTTNDVPTTEPGVPEIVTTEPVTAAPVVTKSEAVLPIDNDQFAATVGRNWGVLVAFGVILLGLGAAVLAWPEATIGVLAVLLGIALLVSGVFSVIAGLTRSDHSAPLRVLSGVSGVLSIVLGGLALTGITEAVTILALMVGFGWIVRGIAELAVGISSKGQSGRGLMITAGVLGLLAGGAVLVWPSITLVVLAYLSAFWLIVFGILQIVMAFRVRKVRSAADLQRVVAG